MAKIVNEQQAYENLANAIIQSAVDDYRYCLNKLKCNLEMVNIAHVNNLIKVINKNFEVPADAIKKIEGRIKSFHQYINPMIDNIDEILLHSAEVEFNVSKVCSFILREIDLYANQFDYKLNKKLQEFSGIGFNVRKYADKAKSLQKFFKSDYYEMLTDLDGGRLIKMINDEINKK